MSLMQMAKVRRAVCVALLDRVMMDGQGKGCERPVFRFLHQLFLLGSRFFLRLCAHLWVSVLGVWVSR